MLGLTDGWVLDRLSVQWGELRATEVANCKRMSTLGTASSQASLVVTTRTQQ